MFHHFKLRKAAWLSHLQEGLFLKGRWMILFYLWIDCAHSLKGNISKTGKGISCVLSQNIFVRTLQLFAECMGHNFVIKALFLCTMHWYFCNQISFLSKSGLLCHWKSNKNALIVSRDRASTADVFVFIVFMSIKMSVFGGACGRWTNRNEVWRAWSCEDDRSLMWRFELERNGALPYLEANVCSRIRPCAAQISEMLSWEATSAEKVRWEIQLLVFNLRKREECEQNGGGGGSENWLILTWTMKVSRYWIRF